MNSIFNRRSIRSFQEKEVEEEKIKKILHAGMQAPSTKDCRCWQFLVVKNENDKKAVSTISEYTKCASKAPVLIIVMADLKKTNLDELWWIEDLSATTQTMLIQIEEEGLGGVWLGVYPMEDRINYIKSYFNLPETVLPFAVIAFGYKKREKPYEDRWDDSKVHWYKY